MIALVAGVLLGSAFATPLVPLLRVTDMAAGRAAAGIAVIAVAVYAHEFWLRLDEADDVPFKAITATLTQVLVAIWPLYAVALIVAALGTLVPPRRRDQ